MADSNITKRALASSLKTLMSENDYRKIGIADICDKCGMNRKSFYYHFRDKYDLINWIFDFEFCLPLKEKIYSSPWVAFLDMCNYFYQNKAFYREAFKIEGQNSFKEHFNEYCYPLFLERFGTELTDLKAAELQCAIFSETLRNAVQLWLSEKEVIPPESFVALIKTSARQAAIRLINEF